MKNTVIAQQMPQVILRSCLVGGILQRFSVLLAAAHPGTRFGFILFQQLKRFIRFNASIGTYIRVNFLTPWTL